MLAIISENWDKFSKFSQNNNTLSLSAHLALQRNDTFTHNVYIYIN